MQTEHRIDELIVDLSFNTTRLARHETALLSDWLSEDLLPALDQLFSHYSPSKQILRFESLEFDFGNLTSRNYQQVIREKLLQQCAQLLQAQLLAVAPTSAHPLEYPSERANENVNTRVALTQLFQYLASGQLSAHRSVEQPITATSSKKAAAGLARAATQLALHEQLLDAVIEQHNIAELLRELPQRDVLIQRLLMQFSLPQRIELLRQLAPQHISSAIALLDLVQFFESHTHTINSDADALQIDYPTVNAQPIERRMLDSHALQQTLWQALLYLGLEHPQATEAFWLSYILRKLAASLSLSERQLQQQFIAIKVPTNSAATNVIRIQTQITQWLANEGAAGENQSDAPAGAADIDLTVYPVAVQHDSEQKNPEQLRQLIAAAFIRADVIQLQQLWPQLMASETQLLLAAVQYYLPQAEIRQQLMLRLPLVLQADVITLLSPALNDIFYRLQNQATALIEQLNTPTIQLAALDNTSESIGENHTKNNNENYNQNNSSAKSSEHIPELLVRQLWEIAVGMLLAKPSTNLDNDFYSRSDTFLMELAARYAELHNLDPHNLQEALHSLLIDQQGAPLSHQQLSHYQPNPDREIAANFAQVSLTEQQLVPTTQVARTVTTAAVIEQANNLLANNLSSISDQQLFDLCLRLKSGALAWSSLAQDIDLLQRLISSYIRLGHNATAENCADFVAAINTQAESSKSPSAFYLTVLQTLVADKLVDLDAIAQGGDPIVIATPTQDRDILITQNSKSISTATMGEKANAQLDALVVQLQQGQGQVEALDLADEQLAHLVDLFIATEVTIAQDIQADFIAAIHLHAQQVINKGNYYRQVLSQLVRKAELDLPLVCAQVNQQGNTKNITSNKTALPSMANDTAIGSALFDNSLLDTASLDNNIAPVAQALLEEPHPLARLRTLQFDHAQWQQLLRVLIQQAPFIGADSNTEFITAIHTFAHRALNQTVYYQLVVSALLQQQPLDLEVFATTACDSESQVAENFVTKTTVSNTGSDLIHTMTMSAAPAQQEKQKLYEFKTEEPTTQLHLDSAITSPPSITESSVIDIIDSERPYHSYPEQAMDYSLLTGSDNSVRKPALSLAQLFAAKLPLTREQLLVLQQHVNMLINHPSSTLIDEWNLLLTASNNVHLLIQSVPAHLLHQILMRLQATRYTWLDAIVKTVMEALALLVNDINSLSIKQVRWTFVFNYLFSAEGQGNLAETSARATELAIKLCEQLTHASGIEDVQRLVNLTQRRIALLKSPAQQKPAMRLQDISINPATHSDETTPQWEAGLHINNAGMVLAAAFLPRLFSMLNLLQDGKFVHPGAADRAVHLVQFMVTGESATPEYDLILNKILCGISTSIPVSAGIEISEQEQTLIEQMLSSMIQHWKVLGSTSISGLRETFFQRQGWLILEEDCWRLKVKEQTFDMLLDRLPWSISLIKHGWMDKPLRVSWRNDS